MATKIKRCLYVGLGGTGMNALLYTKKKFIDTYGAVPPMIGFLGIDTDKNAYNKYLYSITGDEVRLAPNEQCKILVSDARPIYEVQPERFSWIPKKNLYALNSMTIGAGSIRSNGRFAFTKNYDIVKNKVGNALSNISDAHNIGNENYELLSTNTEIHMVFSVCGGTGCGTFINMAYLLKQVSPQCKLTGYAVLPGVFKGPGTAKVTSNAYGAIRDLDYLMHMGIGSQSLNLDYINHTEVVNDRPFNAVLFVDNRNENLDTYTSIDELSEMVSLALVSASGELSSASASVSDNVENNIREGTMDIENKKAWAAGMGACEIVYRGNELSKIYSTKAAMRLIERLFNSCEDTDVIVNAWIDSKDVNIRENNGSENDNVIDFLYDKNPKYELSIGNYANAMQEVEVNLNMNAVDNKVINDRIVELTNRVNRQLQQLLETHINKECGVSTASNILSGIQSQIDIFIGEMKTEKQTLIDNEPRLKSALETAVSDLTSCSKKFFARESELERLAGDVADAARQLAACRIEIARRTGAITVFNSITATIQRETQRIDVISSRLRALLTSFSSDLARIQNGVDNQSPTFQIDLAKESLTSVVVKQDEIQYADFVRMLHNSGKILGFSEMESSAIKESILKYTSTLHSSKEFRSRSIDNVIDKMTEEDLNRTIELAIKKSMPLFRYNHRGYQPKEMPADSFYIGVQDKTNSRLVRGNYFKNKLTTTASVDFSTIGDKSRIIIYRQVGVVPAYAIGPVNDYYKDYIDCNAACYIDEQWNARMEREDFELSPRKATDDDLLDLWVKGIIFGLVKNDTEGRGYIYRNMEEGDPLDDYWESLSQYRDEAFMEFCRHKTIVRKEFVDYLENMVVNDGTDAINAKLQDAKLNYLVKFSQINMTRSQLDQKGNDGIKDLLRRELLHLKTFK